jgi:hypothetical protein
MLARSLWANAHQRVISAEKEFNNWVHRMTYSVDSIQSLSLATLAIAQWTHSKPTMVAGMEIFLWAQQHGLPLTNLTWLCPLLSAQLTKFRDGH